MPPERDRVSFFQYWFSSSSKFCEMESSEEYIVWSHCSFYVGTTRLYTLLCRLVGPSVSYFFETWAPPISPRLGSVNAALFSCSHKLYFVLFSFFFFSLYVPLGRTWALVCETTRAHVYENASIGLRQRLHFVQTAVRNGPCSAHQLHHCSTR